MAVRGLTSDRLMRAERKNRLEVYRLDVKWKQYDKATTQMNFDIDREKRTLVKSFRTVVRTSGNSDEGIPPQDENDNEYEKSPSYRQGLRISNKRLLGWRESEKQLHRFIKQSENEMDKFREKHSWERRSGRGDEVTDREEYKYDDDVFIDDDTLSIGSTIKSSPMDMLKNAVDGDGDNFDVKRWQKDIIQEYKNMVSQPNSRPSSSYSCRDGSQANLRSKSSPSITRAGSMFVPQKPPRPHTAHEPRSRRPISGRSRPRRPLSAHAQGNKGDQSKFLITKDSVYMKTGQKYEKLADNIAPIDKPAMINNFLESVTPSVRPAKALSTSSTLTNLCPVQEDNEDKEGEAMLTGERKPPQVKISSDSDQPPAETEEEGDTVPEIQRPLVSKVFHMWKRNSNDKKSGHRRVSSAGAKPTQVEIERSQQPKNRSSISDISAILAGSRRRSRRDSESSARRSSVSTPSVTLGISSDIEELSKGQDRLVNQVTPDRPVQTNRLVQVGTVVRAALAFSKAARKRALLRMQDENCADSSEIIRQERIRKVQNRANVLSSLANQWDVDSPVIKAVE